MVTVGKIKGGAGQYGPRYQVTLNGRPARLWIEKSAPAKYGHPQMWDVFEDADNPHNVLFDSSSLSGALGVVALLVNLAADAAHQQVELKPLVKAATNLRSLFEHVWVTTGYAADDREARYEAQTQLDALSQALDNLTTKGV